MKLYEKIDTKLVSRLVYGYLDEHPNESIQSIANRSGVNKRTIEQVLHDGRIPRMQNLQPLVRVTGYELQVRTTSVPRCPCETCDHPGKDCSHVCFPFRDFIRALEKRKGQIRRLRDERGARR